MRRGWTDHQQVQFTYGGVDFSCKCSILIGKEGKVVQVSIFELKPTDPGVMKAAREAALKELALDPES